MIIRGKYFDGRSAVSRPVDLVIEEAVLRIDLELETVGRWPLGSIFRDASHTVSVVIGCAAGDDRVEVLDAQIVSALKIESGVWAKRDLDRTRKILIPGFIAFVLLIAFAVWNSRILTRYLASKVTPQQEQKVLAMVEKGKVEDECALNEKQSAALNKLLARLYSKDPENRSHVNVKILKIDANNAFTLPGGSIWILKPLLNDVQTSSELAGVLAHEIEHVERRHIIESVIRAAIFTGVLNAAAGDVSGLMLIDPNTAAQILGMKLSREMEQEADDGALVRMKATGISPIGAADFFIRLEKRDPTPESLSFLSTHPGSEERAKRFWAADTGKTDPPIMTDDEWKDLKSACELP
ncbi:hypothetical protein BH10BDE1_BH10BDE1_16110 [soil metagenome]